MNKKNILIAGSTGLIGSDLIGKLDDLETIENITTFVRRKTTQSVNQTKITEIVIDFEEINQLNLATKADYFICCLGTTIKNAKTKEFFYKVDHDYPLELAKFALKQGIKHFVLISALGANVNSNVFYNKTKGQLEKDILELNFESIHIIRPSLLLGKRKEFRFAEKISQLILYPFLKLIPQQYRPINITIINNKILQIIDQPQIGINYYEGSSIYNI